jgi:hypothetical protein
MEYMKTIQYVMASIIVMTMYACADDLYEGGDNSEIRIVAELPQTRTSYSEGNNVMHVSWRADDAIGVFTSSQKNLKYKASNDGTSTEFVAEGDKIDAQNGDTVFAYYPYNADATSGEFTHDMSRQSPSFSASDHDYMYAAGVVKNGKLSLQFQHVYTFLKITLKPTDLGELGTLGIYGRNVSPKTLQIKENKLAVKDVSTTVFYNLNREQKQETNDVTIYVLMSPVQDNVEISFRRYKSDGKFDKCIFSKYTPDGGLQAGRMYKVSASNEIEEYVNYLAAQRSALVDLYNATDGANWTNSTNWCSDKDLKEWNGVTISNVSGTLNYLNLSNNKLSGTLPESFVDLMNAQYIYMYNNGLSGTIPNSIVSHKNWSKHWNRIVHGNSFSLENVPAPKFSLKDVNGNLVTSDIYAKNKLTVLFNWAVGEGGANPFVTRMIDVYGHYHDKGLEIIGFDNIVGSGYDNADTEEEMVNYIKENNIKWPNVPNRGDGNTLYFIRTYPQVYIVDSNGNFVFGSSYSDAPAFITNYMSNSYVSSDYSRDGETFTIQKATVGKGINLVFMGDGFVDRDMESCGWYEQKMKAAADEFFSLEPYKSFRNRFNVYGVKVVSKNELWSNETKDHRINEDDLVAFDYASKVANDEAKYVTVVYSSAWRHSRSYTRFHKNGSFVAYIMETRKNLVVHEACGHGFGKLRDEYFDDEYKNNYPSDEDKTAFDDGWIKYGRNANVDWRKDLTAIRWAHMINDSRYASEKLGAYEGAAASFGKGMYRPTENSIMHSTATGEKFNAPCREQIYKNIMKQSEGSDWVYDYEKFVEYDVINRTSSTRSLVTAPTKAELEETRAHHRAPVYCP